MNTFPRYFHYLYGIMTPWSISARKGAVNCDRYTL